MPRFFRTLACVVFAGSLAAIALPSPASGQPTAIEQAIAGATPAANPATLTVGNRPVIEFRAAILGRQPIDRVEAARVFIDRLVDDRVLGPVAAQPVGEAFNVTVGGRTVFSIVPADADPLLNESAADKASRASATLQLALNEIGELRRPSQLLWAVVQAVGATALFGALLVGILRVFRNANIKVAAQAHRQLQKSVIGNLELIRESRLIDFANRLVSMTAMLLCLVVGYMWLTFVLRRFPYTRPIGESLRGMLLGQLSAMASAVIAAAPSLFTVFIIFVLTRFATRLAALFFEAVENGRVVIPWLYPETAQPSRKLVTIMLWLFAVAVAYPYLPGSSTEAFKGVSVFIGLIVSLGSSGLMNQIMSGFTVTYSRALRLGDFVKIGDIEGVVSSMDTLSMKLKTLRGEDVTIPNAVTVSQTVINYSRLAATEGVFMATTVGIGYETPWRKIEAMLKQAAAQSPLVRQDPAPVVRLSTLGDFAVTYTLFFCPADPLKRFAALTQVHANILDIFNEFGVQIMTPAYEGDPAEPKVVPKDRWYDSPSHKD